MTSYKEESYQLLSASWRHRSSLGCRRPSEKVCKRESGGPECGDLVPDRLQADQWLAHCIVSVWRRNTWVHAGRCVTRLYIPTHSVQCSPITNTQSQHLWSCVVRGCRRTATELFRSPRLEFVTVCHHTTSRLHSHCLFSAVVSRLISSDAVFLCEAGESTKSLENQY